LEMAFASDPYHIYGIPYSDPDHRI
jgi:hypothetical protein